MSRMMYLSYVRKHLQTVDVLYRPVCAKAHICFTLMSFTKLHLLFPEILYELDTNSL